MQLLTKLEKAKDTWFLLLTSIFFSLLRFPSLFEPYWYGDEGIYQVLGLAMRQGKLLYRDIWDNKPPLLYMVYEIFSANQFSIRLVSLIVGIATVIAFFFLAKSLYTMLIPIQHKRKHTTIIYGLTLLFAFLFGIPLLEGNIANAENFMLLPIITAAFLLFSRLKQQATLAAAGALLSIAFLFKIVAIFDFAAFFVFLLLITYHNKKSFVATITELFLFLVGFSIPILLTFGYFFMHGVLKDFLQAVFVQNVGYVGHGNTLLIPQGLLIAKVLLLGIVCWYLFRKRTRFNSSVLFIFLWFSFSLFNAFFSQRPYTHYLLVLLPSYCLFFGLIFLRQRKKLFFSLFIAATLVILPNFWFYRKTFVYYQNFLSYMTNQKSVSVYQGFFDRNTPRDYTLASFITLHAKKNDRVFIWGNNAQVYALTSTLPPGRYTVAYHILKNADTLQETEMAIHTVKPRFIIVMPNVPTYPFSLASYGARLTIDEVYIYERLF